MVLYYYYYRFQTYMFYYGRFFTGISTAGYCLAIPIYTAEISEKEIRGTLGTYLQLQITIGVLAVYIIGSYVSTLLDVSFLCVCECVCLFFKA